MTKIDIISGFLGAGKTTLIKKLLNDALKGEQVVLIENEFGEIGIDGGFLKEAGVQITEMNSGCICCSLVGDFATALKEVIEKYHPDRILIEPSGVGKLSDVIRAVSGIQSDVPVELNSFVTVVDAGKAKIYIKNFGEFFNNQVESANTIILSRTQGMSQEKLEACVALLREHNAKAAIVTTPWDELTGAQMKAAMEQGHSLAEELLAEMEEEEEHEHHHHHHDDDDDECGCGHHHHHDDDDDDDDEDEHEHHHHHHDHDEEEHEHHHHDEDEHEHHHHHDHDDDDDDDEECSCGCGHHHHHHGHHHADDVFTSWGQETPHVYAKEDLEQILEKLSESSAYGVVLRAKGIVPSTNGWLQFDLTPGEYEIREGSADYTGRLCVIGSELKEDELLKLFQLA